MKQICLTVILLTLAGCEISHKKPERETIFNKVISVPKELVLDVPLLPPFCDEIAGLKKGFIDIRDGKLYYEEEGHGIPLVLVNGGPGGTHHSFHPYFSQIKDTARVIYYDQRGTGKSSKDSTGKTYTIKQAVEDLESLRKALKIERWVVLGWSYGGLLAQCYALTYPQCCMGLILIASTTGLPDSKMQPELERMFISTAERDAIKKIKKMVADGEITQTQGIYNMYYSGAWKHFYYYKPPIEEFVKCFLYVSDADPGFRPLMLSESNEINVRGMFDDFEIPTLITEARWDLGWMDPDRARAMRKNHPHAQVEIFEKSGHNIFADEPEKFFSLLKNFLETSSKTHVIYKPGNRLAWPWHLLYNVRLAQSIPSKSEREKLILDCYEQALKANSKNAEVWSRLGYDFIASKKNYDKCLIVLQKLEEALKATGIELWQKSGYCIKAWQGHMFDLLGKRREAIRCYQAALKTNNGRSDKYFDDSIEINKQWLEERLKSPFTWELFEKAI